MRRLGLVVALTLLPGCARMAAGPPVGAEGGVSGAPAGGATQTLYRVRYDGPEGDGSLRLVLRQVAPDRFQLQAADTFGRAVWALDYADDTVLLLDHRREEACVAGRELRVPELALRPLPLPAVARVLAGETPLPAPPGADPADWTDEAGQRWTVRREEERLAAWTLWQAGEPQLWWTRQASGGVLSHRDGSQFRWRTTAREEIPASSYQRLEAPEGYEMGTCRTGPGPV